MTRRGDVCELCIQEAQALALQHDSDDWTDFIAVVEARTNHHVQVDTLMGAKILAAVSVLLFLVGCGLLLVGRLAGVL